MTDEYERMAYVVREQREMLDTLLHELKMAKRSGIGRSHCLQLELHVTSKLARLDREAVQP